MKVITIHSVQQSVVRSLLVVCQCIVYERLVLFCPYITVNSYSNSIISINLLLLPPSGLFSSVFVGLLAGLRRDHSNDFHRMQWKGGTRATEETIRFW